MVFPANGQAPQTFNIISLDVNVLGNLFAAQSAQASVRTAPQSLLPASQRGPAVIAPWQLPQPDRNLAGRFNSIRDKTDFIDLNSDAVERAGDDVDSQTLFAAYTALSDLRTIAEYAADDLTSTALLERLDSQFRAGLAQVESFVKTAELDKLTLLLGDKSSNVVSDVSLGKDADDLTGNIVPVISATSPLLNVNGDETFTIRLDKLTDADDITIDLSEITGDISLTAIVNQINEKIVNLRTTDTEGNDVAKYRTRFEVEEVAEGDFALKIDGNGSETVTLTAATTEPGLIITGTNSPSSDETPTGSFLGKLKDIEGADPTKSFVNNFTGTDAANPTPEFTDEDGETVPSEAPARETNADKVVVDSQGNLYVIGSSQGDFNNQRNSATTSDVFLSKFDSNGNVIFSRLLGSSDTAEAFDVAVDANDNVVVVGQVNSEIDSADVFSGADSFVAKYDSQGTQIFARQLDSVSTDRATSVAIDAAGDIFITGDITGRLNTSTTQVGGQDGFVVKLNGSDGTTALSTQFGTTSTDGGQGIVVDADGNVLVASEENGRAVIRKFDGTDLTNQLASIDVGDLAGGNIAGLAIENGTVFLAGTTSASSFSNGGSIANAANGGNDGFVVSITNNATSLSANFTSFLGSSSTETLEDIIIQDGNVYVAGTTNGSLAGETKTGLTDAFTVKLDASNGSVLFNQQIGTAQERTTGQGIVFTANGTSILSKLGLPTGTLDRDQERDIFTQTTLQAGDHFYVSVNDGRQTKITIREGDTFDRIARRINRVSLSNVDAKLNISSDGDGLKIQGKNDSRIELFAGEDGQDALVKLGIEPQKILSANELFNLNDDEEGTDPNNLGGVFALGLDNFALRSKQEADFVFNQLSNTLSTIERAFRSLTFDPIKAQILEQSRLNSGVPPAAVSRQLANYTAGLNRLIAGGGGLFI